MVEPSVKKFVAAASKTRDLIRLPNLTVEERLMGAAAKVEDKCFLACGRIFGESLFIVMNFKVISSRARRLKDSFLRDDC